MNEARELLRESLATIERLQARLDGYSRAAREPIAIVGVGCRYPGGVDSIDGLWRVASEGVDAVREVPADRWDIDAYYDPNPDAVGKMVTRRAGMLDRVDGFDPAFFAISPREARALDPQQRMLLETSVEALESAAIATDKLAGSRTGVFVGGSTTDYGQLLMHSDGSAEPDHYAGTGGALNSLSGRIAFTFGLQGPCVTIDTACSSALTAVHVACQSLRARECELALAGGVNVVLLPDAMVLFSRWGMLAPDGRCKTFDAAADGMVRAEGCGVFALKRLSDALAAGDPIRAVIRGSAVNSDGRSSGITVPNGPAQEAVVRAALASAGLSPADVDFVEAHGTGTPIGDPIEVEALAASYGPGRPADLPLLVGSVKANLGHTEAASGAAGLLKAVAALEQEQIPAQINYSQPNPRIDWANIPVRVVDKTTIWRRSNRTRRAGVSAFGLSGTNAHIIVEEAPVKPLTEVKQHGPLLVPFSAHNAAALRELTGRHAAALSREKELALADVAATLGMGRAHLPHRMAVIAGSTAELTASLKAYCAGEVPPGVIDGGTRARTRGLRTAFLFTGQGAQYIGMGRGLYEREPVFRDIMDRAAALLGPIDGVGLLNAVYPPSGGCDVISRTIYTQPALYALEVALAELWRSWGVSPSIVMGHSVGEYAAACVAGVFSFEDGLKLIAERGRLMQALPAGGAMAAMFVNETDAAARIKPFSGKVSIGALNGPEETVISGDAEAIAAVVAQAESEGVGVRRLDVSHAFHSARLDPMLDALETCAKGISYNAPRVPMLSNLTGEIMRHAPDARYWRDHARQAVRFAASVQKLEAEGVAALIEIGPHPTLLALAGRAAPAATWLAVPSLRNGRDDTGQILEAVGNLYVAGITPNWEALQARSGGCRRPLPTYPFQNERYWIDRKEKKTTVPKGAHILLGARQIAEPPNASFVATVARDEPAFLAEHVVLGRTLFPGAAFIEMALAAAQAVLPGTKSVLRRFSIEAPLALAEGETETLVTQVEEQEGRSQIRIRQVGEKAWRDLARCHVEVPGATPNGCMVAELRGAKLDPIIVADYYDRLESLGLSYGPNFRGVRELWSSPNGALGRLELPADAPGARDPYNIHPALLDSAFHVLGGALLSTGTTQADIFLPIGADAIRWLRPAGRTLWAGIKVVAGDDPDARIVDIALENDGGELVGVIEGLEVRRVNRDTLERALEGGARAHTYQRVWREIIAQSEPKTSDATYLVVGGSRGFGAGLVERLTNRGGKARMSASYEPATLRAAIAEGDPPNWVIACDLVENACEDLDPPARAAIAYGRHLVLTQVMAEFASLAGLCVLTQGAQAIEPGDPGDPAQAAIIGFARTLAAERPEAPSLRLDLDPWARSDAAQAADLVASFVGTEVEVAVRHGSAFAPRLEALARAPEAEVTQRQVVRIETRGDLDNLRLISERRRAPGRGEVEIDVRAAGLNFRDVLNALGMYPGDAGRLGSEVSGIVSAVGAGVTGFSVGDPVVAFTGDSIATHAVASSVLTTKLPAGADFADAVTVPNTYLTAALCFSAAGGLKPGMRVLIHAGAGGVGLAAVRLAKLAGAEIFATAGSPAKRAFVRKEGARRVFDSRKAAFAEAILDATEGVGVDIVVNSLTGAFIPESFRALRSGGTFVEIGKAEILTQEQAAAHRADVTYLVGDLGEEILRDAAEVGRGLGQAVRDVACGRTSPLPVQAFALEEANAAFRFMANARHTGKIVLLPKRTPAVRRDGTYLVTGGLGGLGLATARWLAERGAGQIVLTARSEPSAEQLAAVAALRDGSPVRIVRCDVSDRAALEAMVNGIMGADLPLRGVFHAAGVLDDATLDRQDQARYAKVAGAKSDAAWWLSELTSGAQLDFFVLFSSSSSVFGSPGQANYSASNAFLDGLAARRRAHGKVGTSIAWGAWDEVGMAAKLDERVRARWAQAGVGLLRPRQAISAMEAVLSADLVQAAILAVDTARFAENASPYVAGLFANLVAGKSKSTAGGSEDDADLASDDPARRQVAMAAFVRREIARVLGFSAASLDENAPLHELGLDSLMAVQFRKAVSTRLGLDVPLKRLLQGVTAAELIVELSREEFVL
jgi:acyl transferase domain-containing protein/NADPH:quinone reductase-like Zn-dependent oxidoreductase/acyl carrier protein